MSQALIMKFSNSNAKVSPCLRIFIETLFEGSIAGTPSPDLSISGEELLVSAGLANRVGSSSEARDGYMKALVGKTEVALP
jgi:hypothetical protein